MTTYQLLFKKGFTEGTDHGIKIQRAIIVKNMIQHGYSVEKIALLLDLDSKSIEQILRELK